MVNADFADFVDDHRHALHVGMQQQFGDEGGFAAAQKPSDQGHGYFSGQRIARPSHERRALNGHFKNVQTAGETIDGVDDAAIINIHIVELNRACGG